MPGGSVYAQGADPFVLTTPGGPGVSSSAFKDYFTIFNFAGFNGLHSEPANWTFWPTGGQFGPAPSDVGPVDRHFQGGQTWFYTGPEIIAGSDPLLLGSFAVGSHWADRNPLG
jgi:hypothetical protein